MSEINYSKKMAALRLLTDIQDQENGKEERCWRSFTDDLFFQYWLGREVGYSLLDSVELKEVENHIAVCHWCLAESVRRACPLEENSAFMSEDTASTMELPVEKGITLVDETISEADAGNELPLPVISMSKRSNITFSTKDLSHGKNSINYGKSLSVPAIELASETYTILLSNAAENGLAPKCTVRQEIALDGAYTLTVILRPASLDTVPPALSVAILHGETVLDEKTARKTGGTYRAYLCVPPPLPAWEEILFRVTAGEKKNAE